jgi:hypothetical protein
MIILSVGMPRAGSGWYYNLTHDLVTASGGQDAREIRQRYHLQSILTEVNCNIGALTPRRLLLVLIPSLMGNTFVIKAHAGPSPMAQRLIRMNLIRPAYIYRDPRDALVSAYDNGQRARAKGRQNAFSHLVDFDTSLEFMQQYLDIWEDWIQCPQALHTRYEDLLSDYESEAGRLVKFLELDEAEPNVRTVVDQYQPKQARSGGKGLHFNRGQTGRFREKLSPQEQTILAEQYGPYLEKMGYPL